MYPRTGPEHNAGEVGADYVVGQVMALRQRRQSPIALQETERGDRFEDAGPDGVVVDCRCHHRHQRLARAQLRSGNIIEMQAASRVLVARREPFEHVGLVAVHRDAAIGLRHRQRCVVSSRRVASLDGRQDFLHAALLLSWIF